MVASGVASCLVGGAGRQRGQRREAFLRSRGPARFRQLALAVVERRADARHEEPDEQRRRQKRDPHAGEVARQIVGRTVHHVLRVNGRSNRKQRGV